MFIIFFLFLVSAFYFFFNFDFLTICHPSPTTRYPPPAEKSSRRKPLENGLFCFIALIQFRYTWYRPQTKKLRARQIGLQYKIRKAVDHWAN